MANFASSIVAAAIRAPDRPAIELMRGDQVETTSYAQLATTAATFARWLADTGGSRGDRVAILADNDAHWIACYLGALCAGWIAVPLDTSYSSDQVRTVIDNCAARVLLTTPRYLETARSATNALTRLALLSDVAAGAGASPRVTMTPPPVVEVSDDDAAVILYTSGTTADPKGVVLTHANLDAERRTVLSVVPVTADDAVLGVLPLFHALAQMANLLLPLAVGARVVFLETVSSGSVLSALASRGITIFACVPQFFYLIHQRVVAEVSRKGRLSRVVFRALVGVNVRLRDRFGWNPGRVVFRRVHLVLGSRMRLLVTGGSRFDPAVGRDLYGMGFVILNAYGLTETSGAATMMRLGDRFTSSVGQALPGIQIRIGDDRAPEDGEVLVRGPILMREYFNRPDATAEALRDGWLYTGDLGRLDGDGRLYITGRRKEIIVLGSGKNLYPEEIEAHYQKSPFIKELCVLGLTRPDEPSAERLHAVVVPDEQTLRERGIVNVRELIRFELETLSVPLPAYKRILGYDISFEPLPRTTTGKIRRHQVERRLQALTAERGTAPERPLTDEEQTWLATPARRATLDAIAARLNKSIVHPSDNLELDLGLDSMERVELLAALELRAATRVPPQARAQIFTVRQLIEALGEASLAPTDPASFAPAEPVADVGWDELLAGPPDEEVVALLSRRQRFMPIVLWVVGRSAAVVARLLLRLRVSGLEHLPATGVFIICPNHQSHLDGFVIGTALPFRVLRSMFYLGAAEYYRTTFTRAVSRMLRIVPIDPDANLINAMRAGATGLRLDRVLVLFPEGERSIDGDLKAFRKGAAILSAHTGAALVPVAVDGLFPLWPRGRSFQWRRLLPWRSDPATIRFGPPLHAEPGREAEATEALRAAVAAELAQIRQARADKR